MKYSAGIVLISLLAVCAGAAEIHVAPGADLQAAINGLSDGDILQLPAGEYRGSILIDRRISLIGTSFPMIHGENKGDVVTVTAPGVLIRGVEVVCSGNRLLEDEAGFKIEADDVTVENCRITDTLHGIYIKGGNRIVLRDNTIRGREDLNEALRGNGIHLWNSAGNLVEGNDIRGARDGIYFSFAKETRVTGNHIHHLRYGLHYMYSDDNTFVGNIFELNVAGAALMYSKRIIFEANIFAHNRGYRAYGVLYQSCDHCQARDNLIIDNTRGIFFNDSNFNQVRGNDVADNDIAVQFNASCEENRIFLNNFLHNMSGVLADTQRFPNQWSDEGKGNYWSDYRGYDLDGDLIGDHPHALQSVFEYLEVDFPEVRLYLFSPAAQVLEIAEKTLPILRASHLEDPFPLIHQQPNGGVPWSMIDGADQQASWPAALLFLLMVFSPLLMLVWYRT
jgi:nitrous oxidase accessory protein